VAVPPYESRYEDAAAYEQNGKTLVGTNRCFGEIERFPSVFPTTAPQKSATDSFGLRNITRLAAYRTLEGKTPVGQEKPAQSKHLRTAP